MAVWLWWAGEFDAFNTIMAILRMRKKQPALKPGEYYDADKDFRDFIDCVPGAHAAAALVAVAVYARLMHGQGRASLEPGLCTRCSPVPLLRLPLRACTHVCVVLCLCACLVALQPAPPDAW